MRKYVMLCYVTLDQRGCGLHGDASFHHDIVPECQWPSSSLVGSETSLSWLEVPRHDLLGVGTALSHHHNDLRPIIICVGPWKVKCRSVS